MNFLPGRDVEGIVVVIFHRARDRDAAIGRVGWGFDVFVGGQMMEEIEFETDNMIVMIVYSPWHLPVKS